MLDLIIRGGTVVDGTGGLPFAGDVAVQRGRIVAVGSFPGAEAEQVLEAAGLIVAPGFIDIHSHSDFTLLVDPRAQSAIAQGVTTELVGNCGHGCAPITDPELLAWNVYGFMPGIEIDWVSMAGYLERLDAGRPAVNVASLVPNGNLRLAVLGRADRPATSEESGTMAHLLDEALEQGAFGFSTGLESPTERAITESEVIALCRVVARRGALYASHTRNKETLAAEAV